MRESFDCLILRGLQDFSREFFENYTVKENGSFSEIKQKKRVESFVYRDICERAVREIARSYENISFADMKHNEKEQQSLIQKSKAEMQNES